jgi:hypothetical protein
VTSQEDQAALLELLQSQHAEDRASAAFRLAGVAPAPLVRAALRSALTDPDPTVVAFAAQSLAVHEDVLALAQLVHILDRQDGAEVTPVAWAVATLASHLPATERSTARSALLRLRGRGVPGVVAQVDTLLAALSEVPR